MNWGSFVSLPGSENGSCEFKVKPIRLHLCVFLTTYSYVEQTRVDGVEFTQGGDFIRLREGQGGQADTHGQDYND